MGADHNHAVGRIPDDYEGGTQQELVQKDSACAVSMGDTPSQATHKKKGKSPVSRSKRQPHAVDG